MKKSICRIIAGLLLLSAGYETARAQSAPRSVATNFYQTTLKLNIRGLPDPVQHQDFLGMLDPGLKSLLEAARVEQIKFIKEHPDEKPPWIEGDLFSSLFEGPQSFTVGAVRLRGRRAEVDIRLVHKEQDSIVRWIDTLVLSRQGTNWKVFDIVFKGDWQFKGGNTLRGSLKTD